MRIGKVINNVWSTRKEESLVGTKFMIVQLMDSEREFKGTIIVAADLIGAGIGEEVIISQGSSARRIQGTEKTPIDAIIVGIIDQEKADQK